MKTYWVLGPSPYEGRRTIHSAIYSALIITQQHVKRALTRQEIVRLIKGLKQRKAIYTVQDCWSVASVFLADMQKRRLLTEIPPEGALQQVQPPVQQPPPQPPNDDQVGQVILPDDETSIAASEMISDLLLGPLSDPT